MMLVMIERALPLMWIYQALKDRPETGYPQFTKYVARLGRASQLSLAINLGRTEDFNIIKATSAKTK